MTDKEKTPSILQRTSAILGTVGLVIFLSLVIATMWNWIPNPPQPRKPVEVRFCSGKVKGIKHEQGIFTSRTTVIFENRDALVLSGIYAIHVNTDGIARFKHTDADGWEPALPQEPSKEK